MPTYQFLFLTDDGSLSDAQRYECADDLDALDKGHELCALHTVEAWIDERTVFTLNRGAVAARSIPVRR